MPRFSRPVLALAAIALLPPCTAAAVAVHLLVEHGEHGLPAASAANSEAGLHGHAHPDGTPDHDHSLLTPMPAAGARVVAPPAGAFRTWSGALLAVGCATIVGATADYAARAGPTAALSSVLRI